MSPGWWETGYRRRRRNISRDPSRYPQSPDTVAEISIGSLDSSIVHPREVFKEALAASAAAVIFVHNHPSGDTEPSGEDIKVTKRLKEAGDIMGIDVLDHVIIGGKEYRSMKRQGLF
jgi:DNA repair protein RadC